jgi:hypothetical protein
MFSKSRFCNLYFLKPLNILNGSKVKLKMKFRPSGIKF